jgi:N-acetyl sugar amidotransferase
MNKKYQICNRCIMDTSDPEIVFDEIGNCNHCNSFYESASKIWFPNEEGAKKLNAIINEVKQAGLNQEYDCVIGLSGGVDSSYLAYKAKESGLRPLAVHIDAGWNSELAVKNIENIVKKLNIDLYTCVIDWEEMRDLQIAFLRSGVANQDTPQDHAFFAALYGFAVKENIKYVLSGSNHATEFILPSAWGYDAMDSIHLKAIHKRFGKRALKTFPLVNFFDLYINYRYIKKMKVVAPLNYMPYSKNEAIKVLEQKLDWKYYGGKHYESRFTKFFQGYYLPKKFGYDKRKAHLSSLVVSGQMTREEALIEMQKDAYPSEQIEEDKEFIIKKLDLTESEFEDIINIPNTAFSVYPSNYKLKNIWRLINSMINRVLRSNKLGKILRKP